MSRSGHPDLADLRSIAHYRLLREAAMRAAKPKSAPQTPIRAGNRRKSASERPCRPHFEPIRRSRRGIWG